MKKAALIAGLALASLLATPALAAEGDVEAGRAKAETCLGCHGIPNYTNVYPTYRVPKLGGQHADQIFAALQAYRSGERQHPTMSAQAASMSDEDMRDVAAYFAQVKPGKKEPRTYGGNPQAGQEKTQVCATCHGADGKSPNPAFPVLAGQYADYLAHALRAYKLGERTNPIMAAQVATLSEQDILDLAAWFAAQDEGLNLLSTEAR
ncbi:MAG TPA: c-type cytochrome [Gammaproteobacteria bacterium]|nr:c-type cytochrome [Gammaproteobacteria bacterium]